jgi:hypothetical protein
MIGKGFEFFDLSFRDILHPTGEQGDIVVLMKIFDQVKSSNLGSPATRWIGKVMAKKD